MHREHFSSCYLGPFRGKLAVEAEKQFSSVLLNLSFCTDFPSRAVFSQEYSGGPCLLPSRNEGSSCLLSAIKLRVSLMAVQLCLEGICE